MDLFGDEPTPDVDVHDAPPTAPVDDIDGLQCPSHSHIFLGHKDVEQQCLTLWNSNKMPHAIILNGIKGIGKATFAYRLARFILKETGDDAGGLFGGDDALPQTMDIARDDPVFRKVMSGGHPDLKVVTRPFDERKGKLKTIIGRDELRVIPPFFSQKSAMGGWQVVIVDDANMMSADSQNVILKILEEPPKKAILILVTHGVGGLIPTIRSRCRFMPFDPLDQETLQDLLSMGADNPLMPDDLDILTSLAQGSAGQGLTLFENGGIDFLIQVLQNIASLDKATAEDIDNMSLSIGKSGSVESIERFLYILHWWFDQQIHMQINGQSRIQIGHINVPVLPNHTLQSILKLHECVEGHIKTCQIGNLDNRYMIFKLLRMIQDGK
jgi:DNA polymerase-3 subunit delta'